MAITKITTPELFDFSATNTALQLPTGDTASRPSAPSAGEWRYNTTLKYVEFYDGTTPYDAAKWFRIDTEAIANPDTFPRENFNVNTYFGNGATQTIDVKFNEAANFNGSSSKIDLPNFMPSGNAARTVSMWIKTTQTTAATLFKYGGANTNLLFDFRINDGGTDGGANTIGVGFYGSANDFNRPATTLMNGNWHNVVTTFDGTDCKIYIDGVQTGTTKTLSGTANTTATTAVIGSDGGTFLFNGSIDQVRVYNTALTDAQAEDLYTDETTTTAATLNFPVGAGCIAAYQLDGDASDVGGTYGGSTTSIGYTGLKFQPDFVWLKGRGGDNHNIADSVRGVQKFIFPNLPSLEFSQSSYLTAFDTNGFTLGNDGSINANGQSFVGWSLKAGGAPDAINVKAAGLAPTPGSVMIDGVKSTAVLLGTIAAKKISANTASGFSIVQHEANNSNDTIAHCLSSAPDLIISKQTDASGAWGVYNSASGTGNYLYLNEPYDVAASASVYPTVNSTVFAPGSGGWNFGTGTYIHYCFANTNGFQRISTYFGNSLASGPIVYTTSDGTATGTNGFEPAFVMIKATNFGSNADWVIFDNKRDPNNTRKKFLYANSNAADGTASSLEINFYTNGFQPIGSDGTHNGAGTKYLYLAIAADKDSSVPTAANSLDTVIYTGTGTTAGDLLNVETSLTPSFVWVKNRNVAVNHYLYDSTRGTGDAKALHSNDTASQASASAYADNGGIAALSPNSFTAYRGSDGTYQGTNLNADNYVAWTWRAGGLPTINDDGDITSIVSANPAAGFSIVNYNGNGTTGGQKIGHGLEKTPELFFIKRLDAVSDWVVYSAALTGSKYLILDTNQGELTAANIFNDTDPSSTAPYVFTVGDHTSVNATNGNYISYCFASCVGYVDIGSYSGLSTGTNTHVTGFEPSFVMIKGTNFADSWYMYDNKRRTPPSSILFADLSDVEYTTDNTALYVTFVSGGVGVGGFTTSGAFSGIDGATRDFIYIAIK